MRISGAVISFVGLLLLSGCGAAVKGCARAAVNHAPVVVEHVPVAKAPVIHDIRIHSPEGPTSTTHIKPDVNVVREPEHSKTESLANKILEEIPKEGGKKAIEAATKGSESNSDSKSRSEMDERR